MTISTETSEVVYLGNDVTSTFPFTFPIFASAHLVVTHVDANGVETPQVESTHYTLSWDGPGKTGSVNRIRIVLGVPEAYPLATGESYHIERTVPLVQQVDLMNNTRLRLDQIEKGLDYLTQITQQQNRKTIRTIRVSDIEAGGDSLQLPPLEDRADSSFTFDSNGDPIAGPPIPLPSDVTPTSITTSVGLIGSISGKYALADHKHPYDPSDAGWVTFDDLSAEESARIAADNGKVNRVGDDAVTGTLTVGSSKPLDQAGTGQRMVLAQASGQQRAEARAEVVESAGLVNPGAWIGVWDFEGGVANNRITGTIAGAMTATLPGFPGYTLASLTAAGAAVGSYGIEWPSPPATRSRACLFSTTFTTSLYTVAFFARSKTGTAGNMPLLELGATTNGGDNADSLSYDRLRINGTTAQVRINGGSYASITYPTSTTWAHYAFVVTVSGSVKVYKNGSIVETVAVTPGSGTSSTIGAIMLWNADCCMDAVAFYNGELSASAIAVLAAGGFPAADGTLTPAALVLTNLDLRITKSAGASQRMLIAALDGTVAPAPDVVWTGTWLQIINKDVAAVSANGIVTRTASGTFTARTVAAASGSGLSVSNGDGLAGNPTVSFWVSAPANATSSGSAGQAAYDASYLYLCVATNTWRRVAHASW